MFLIVGAASERIFKMKHLPFILSLSLHLGFFFLLIKASSVPSPELKVVEVTVISPKAKPERKSKGEETKVIPKGDVDAVGKECPYTYGGIGIQTGILEVVTVIFEGYAADRAGLKVGDMLIYTGEIRGEPGTTLILKVFRNFNYLDFTIIREKICYDI